jgi:hypothetical protein
MQGNAKTCMSMALYFVKPRVSKDAFEHAFNFQKRRCINWFPASRTTNRINLKGLPLNIHATRLRNGIGVEEAKDCRGKTWGQLWFMPNGWCP